MVALQQVLRFRSSRSWVSLALLSRGSRYVDPIYYADFVKAKLRPLGVSWRKDHHLYTYPLGRARPYGHIRLAKFRTAADSPSSRCVSVVD